MLSLFDNKIVVSKTCSKYATIMEAINSTAVGSEIYIEEGVYHESLTFAKDVTLIGTGNVENIIINGENNSALVISETNVQIEGVTILNSGTDAAIQVTSTGRAEIRNCIITSENSNGIIFTNSNKGSLIDNCVIKNTGSNSIVISENSNPVISHCRIFNSNAAGIFVKENGNGHILHSEIFENEYANIAIDTEATLTIDHCKIYNSKQCGILVMGNGHILHSDIFENENVNIVLHTADNPIIDSCKIYRSKGIGISLTGNAYILHSDIFENESTNILIDTAANPTIDRCKIYRSQSYGIQVKENGLGHILHSDIFENKEANIKIDTAANPTIDRCKIYRSTLYGISVTANGLGHILHSDIFENDDANILIDTAANPTIDRCKIYNSTGFGILVIENGLGHILHSDIFENEYSNIEIDTAGNPTIDRCKIYRSLLSGISVTENGLGHILNSDIFENGFANIKIGTAGNPTIDRCKIYRSKENGISVTENGLGHILHSDIFENEEANILIETSANPTIDHCKIYNSKQSGILVTENGLGHILNSDIFDNMFDHQIHLQNNSELTLTNSNVCNGGEYGIYIENSILNMGNNIITNHSKMDIYQDEQSKVVTILPTDMSKVSDDNGSSSETASETKQNPISALEQLNAMFGLANLKNQINQFVNTVKFNKKRAAQGLQTTPITLHSLFLGNPGTGKTTVARLLGKVLFEEHVIQQEKFVEVSRKDLVAQYVGHTAKKTEEVLEQARGGVLFIDEAYSLYKDSQHDFGSEAIDTILKFMEDYRDDIMIIFAGYTDEMQTFLSMNSGLASRIPNRFDFDDYSPEEIGEIGYAQLIRQDYFVNEQKYKEIVMNQYARSVDQSNARWVRNFNQKLTIIMADRVIETNDPDSQSILEVDLYNAIGQKQVNKEEKIQELLEELHNLTGLEVIKQYVQRLVKQVKLDKLLMEQGDMSLNPTYHMIFEGNPGTGKTTVARILSSLFYYLDILPTSNVKFVDRADLVGSYVGHTEKNTKEVLKQAMGGVLFIDEAYQLTNGSANDFGKNALETLLTYLENYRDKFIVILAGYTNEMEAFLDTNPGLRSRIPQKIIFPDYSPEEIATIVETNVTKNWTVDTEYLRQTVLKIYSEVPQNEKSNARWARNFSEKLIQNHKVWLIDNDVSSEQLKIIHNNVIDQM